MKTVKFSFLMIFAILFFQQKASAIQIVFQDTQHTGRSQIIGQQLPALRDLVNNPQVAAALTKMNWTTVVIKIGPTNQPSGNGVNFWGWQSNNSITIDTLSGGFSRTEKGEAKAGGGGTDRPAQTLWHEFGHLLQAASRGNQSKLESMGRWMGVDIEANANAFADAITKNNIPPLQALMTTINPVFPLFGPNCSVLKRI